MNAIDKVIDEKLQTLNSDMADLSYQIRVLINKAYNANAIKKGSDNYDGIQMLIGIFRSQGDYLMDILDHPERDDLAPRE